MDWELSLQQKAGSCRQWLKISVRASGIRCPTRFRPWAEPVLVLHKWLTRATKLYMQMLRRWHNLPQWCHRPTRPQASTPHHLPQVPPWPHAHWVKILPFKIHPPQENHPAHPQPHLWHSIPPDSIYRQMTFFPRNIPEWNGLPQEVTRAPTPGSFATRVCSLLGL